ncbi:MAG: hypothetical protein ALECFALPRED_001321 [Alectoria fallacina]|uniref:Uncharacterized protein n=1 Tax=Alectoria fallacina TaxID=1903189 RepID=A0A8H3IIC5_9LECA|nr:MAG: hypothetical protein ALECFALPRED_001321 [Alectoria fallacina]
MDPTMDPTIDAPPSHLIGLAVAANGPPTPTIATATPTWVPHPYLKEDLHPILQRAIDRIPPSHLLPPSKNETFDTPDDAWTRLQDYAFSQGFAIVTGSCGVKDPRKTYHFIHHYIETKNSRKLPEHKGEQDLEHNTTRLQEMTRIKAKGCEWRVSIAYKDLKRGGSNKTRVLGLGKQEHSVNNRCLVCEYLFCGRSTRKSSLRRHPTKHSTHIHNFDRNRDDGASLQPNGTSTECYFHDPEFTQSIISNLIHKKCTVNYNKRAKYPLYSPLILNTTSQPFDIYSALRQRASSKRTTQQSHLAQPVF